MRPQMCRALFVAALLVAAVRSFTAKEIFRDLEKMKLSSCMPDVAVTLEMTLASAEWMPAAEIAVRISNFLTQVYTRGEQLTDQNLLSLVTATLDRRTLIRGCWIEFEPTIHRRHASSVILHAMKMNGTTYQMMDIAEDRNSPAMKAYLNIRSLNWDHLPMEQLQLQVESRTNDFVQSMYPAISVSDGQLTAPYFECAHFKKWMLSYVAPFFRWIDGRTTFIGATGVHVDLSIIDINQCDEEKEEQPVGNETKMANVFRGSHHCHASTRCSFIKGQGFTRGAYECRCHAGFYFPNDTHPLQAFRGLDEEEYFQLLDDQNDVSRQSDCEHPFQCLPCAEGCETCVDATPCMLSSSALIRSTVLAIGCVLEATLLGLIAFVLLHRERAPIKSASPLFLCIMCVGAMVMVGKLLLRYFKPNSTLCQAAVWFDMIGFSVLFSALLVRMWRIDVLFRVSSAKTLRISDRKLFKRMAMMLLSTTAYMVAWTAAAPEQTALRQTRWRRTFLECCHSWWHLCGHIGETMVLLWGVYLCYRVRRAASAYNESRYVTWAIYNSILTGNLLLLASHFFAEQEGPDIIYIIECARILVVAVGTVAIIFLPKMHATFSNSSPSTARFTAGTRTKNPEVALPCIENGGSKLKEEDGELIEETAEQQATALMAPRE